MYHAARRSDPRGALSPDTGVSARTLGGGTAPGYPRLMAKGFFTQSAAVLFEHLPSLADLAERLASFEVVKTNPEPGPIWMGGPSLLLPLRPEVNGYALVDLVEAPWPDSMGDPQGDVDLFGAWSMGHFGPWVFPGNLGRAQSLSVHWPEARAVSSRHRAFVRLRTSYILGAADDARVLPEDYAPLPEVELVTRVARALLDAPGALAYFNPNGETLHSRESLDDQLQWHEERGLPAHPIWSHVRFFQLDAQSLLMDTAGMEQLDVIDHEARFPGDSFQPGAVASFLRGATNYVFENGPVIQDGDTMDGPGGTRWQARHLEESAAPRPRPVLSWSPLGG